jgi:hypothetical protein
MYDDTTLDVALNQFQANKSHISLVQHVVNTDPDRDPFPVTTGVVTMEVGALVFSLLLRFSRLYLRMPCVLSHSRSASDCHPVSDM